MIPQPEVQQVDYAREALSRQQAQQIVAARIEEWGWGPFSEIDGLAEHELAVKACQAGLAAAFEAGHAEGVREAAEVAARYAEPNGHPLTEFDRGYENSARKIAHRLRALSKEPAK